MTIKDFLPRSLLGRSLIIIVAPLVLLQLVTAYIFYDRHWTTVTRHASTALAGEISALVRLLYREHEREGEAWVRGLAQNMALAMEIRDGDIAPDGPGSADSEMERILAEALRSAVRRPFALQIDQAKRRIALDVQVDDRIVSFDFETKRVSGTTARILTLWMVGTAIIVAAIAILFMRNQIRPIRRLALAAEEFGKGREVSDFSAAGAREVRQAAAAFAMMRDRIRRQIGQRTEMLAGVSHDLRTPLTRMKLQLAMVEDDQAAAELGSDIAEMERMVEDYLAFARGEGTETPAPTDVAPLLRVVVGGARRNGAEIDLHVERDINLPLRPNAFTRSVANLLTNALRYGQHVAVRAGRRASALEITVDDDGPGIAADQREEVFRPFRRLDDARNPDTAGTGLGLTIARDIIRGHGGDLTLDDSPTGGLRARIRVPL